jgi:hypothetical protein
MPSSIKKILKQMLQYNKVNSMMIGKGQLNGDGVPKENNSKIFQLLFDNKLWFHLC